MIDPNDPELKVERWVLYDPPHVAEARTKRELGRTRGLLPWETDPGPLPPSEDGIITSLHGLPNYIHVRFRGDTRSKACKPADLRYGP